MHPFGNLGPIDMQIRSQKGQFSTEDVSAFFEFVRNDLSITDQEHLRALFQDICRDIGNIGLAFSHRSSKLAGKLAEKLLNARQQNGNDNVGHRSLVESLTADFHAHNYPINRSEARELGLPITPTDPRLERLMWDAWLDLEQELKEREPTSPDIELLNSAEAEKLLAPVPMMTVPSNSPDSGTPTANTPASGGIGNVSINPVDFEHLEALLESRRLAFRRVRRGRILATRLPDLTIQWSAPTVFAGWERTSIPRGESS